MAEPISSLCEQHVIDATLKWVDDIVIKHNFCPFARYVRTPNQIRCKVIAGDAGNVIQSPVSYTHLTLPTILLV